MSRPEKWGVGYGPLGRWRADGVTLLCLCVVLLLGIPSTWSVRALGSLGSFALLTGMAAFLWWCWYHLHRSLPEARVQPVRWAIAVLLLACVLSYARSMFLPLPPDEVSPGQVGMIRLLALAGILLVANDGVTSTARLHKLARFLVVGAALVGAFSVVQFITGEAWIDRISIPGITPDTSYGLGERQGLVRPAGTAQHPIEMAAMLTMVLPISILRARSQRWRAGAVFIVVCITLGLVLSLSRTAMLGAVIGIAFVVPALSVRERVTGGLAAVAGGGVLYVSVPGLVGTLRGLFVTLSDDPSVQSRTDSFALVWEFISRSPWIGRGLGTFLPKYWILDNMYLQLLVEIGFVGVLALLGALVTAILVGWRAARRFRGTDRDLTIGMVAGVAAGGVSLAFFDAFAFPQSSTTLFLLVGACGACWNLARNQEIDSLPRAVQAPDSPWPSSSGGLGHT